MQSFMAACCHIFLADCRQKYGRKWLSGAKGFQLQLTNTVLLFIYLIKYAPAFCILCELIATFHSVKFPVWERGH